MNTHTKEEKAKHEHEFTRRKKTSTVETCPCGAFRHTENNANPIIEAVTMDNQAKVKNIMRKEDVKTVRDFLEPYQAKATPRPWVTYGWNEGLTFGIQGQKPMAGPVVIDGFWQVGDEVAEANASLIVKAVNEYDLDKEAIHNYSQKLLGMQKKSEALLSACREAYEALGLDRNWNISDLRLKVLGQAIANATK